MPSEVYADAIARITVLGTTVRLELVSMHPTETAADGKPLTEPVQRLVMSIEGFVRSFGVIQGVIARLEKDGMIGRQAPAAGAVPPASPNFKA
ncbi:MAG: hypothetical protein ACT4P2_11590 [Pseudomonadota bacterium]